MPAGCQWDESYYLQNNPIMQEQEFIKLLSSATESARRFALNYVSNTLPAGSAYIVFLNQSHDAAALTQFDLYPHDNGKVIEAVNAAAVVDLLLRKGKVPVWIDISVSAVRTDKTVFTLHCAGRYSDEMNEAYYQHRHSGPFGIKSPLLPVDYKEGIKFELPGTKKSFWKKLFGRSRSRC